MNACQKCAFAVYDDNPHCGLRGFTTNFNVEWCSSENDKAPNGYELQDDGYFSWINKKKEITYPKTYEECSTINGCGNRIPLKIIGTFTQLINARNAYWRIAGREMNLGESWKPDWTNQELPKYCIAGIEGKVKTAERYIVHTILAFPTEEMRNTFYEYFKSEIEMCKELL